MSLEKIDYVLVHYDSPKTGYHPMQPIDWACYLLAQRKKMRSQKRFFSCLLAIKIDQYIFFAKTYEYFGIFNWYSTVWRTRWLHIMTWFFAKGEGFIWCWHLACFLTKSLLPNYPSPIIVQSFPLMMTVIGSPWELRCWLRGIHKLRNTGDSF